MSGCRLCPRECGVDREAGEKGFCGMGSEAVVARASLHEWEEPCISGENGSGTVFFCGCNLRCVFCQNHLISAPDKMDERWAVMDPGELAGLFLRLAERGAENINLVTPTIYSDRIALAIETAKTGGLDIPVVYNCGGYESVEALRSLEGLVQVYLPDYKYADAVPAKRYSAAEDYPAVAAEAIKEMYRQRGPYHLDENDLLVSGVLIRHMILPGEIENSMGAIDFVAESFPKGGVLFSLMSQYTPMPGLEKFPALLRRVDAEENAHLVRYMRRCGIENGYWQDPASATEEMIPSFDGTGVDQA